MKRQTAHALALFVLCQLFVSVFLCPLSAVGKENCLACHKKLTNGKFKHQALQMGCATCHSAIDAKTTPHKKTNALARGLLSDQPDLCYGCHDKGMVTKKNIHPAVSMGCTGCHNPHSSKYAKLISAKVPALCFTCHNKAGFTRTVVHPPVASGECLTCHSPHATDEIALLLKKPVALCFECHPDAEHGQHSPSRQPSVSDQAAGKGPELGDPVRPGRPFYCGSCHNPHSAQNSPLFRFDVKTPRELCTHCHKM
jgi:predicted CXXCH cytochrome family protein